MTMMGYSLRGYYRLKEDTELETKKGTFKFYTDDVFTKSEDGTYTIHNLLIFISGIHIPEEKLDYFEEKVTLTGI